MIEWKEIARVGGVGILIPSDIPSLKAATRRIFLLMCDGEWHTTGEIDLASTNQRESLRRMRQLRDHGFDIDKRRVSGTRIWEYRLNLDMVRKTNPVDQAQYTFANI